jgi:hypothetical protein
MSAFHTPWLIVGAFFLVQTGFRFVVMYSSETRGTPFVEALFFGPINLAVAALMIMAGIPTDDTVFSLLWIGVSLLFAFSGVKYLYSVMKSNVRYAPANGPIVTARQKEKTVKMEEQLVHDLFSFVDDKNSSGKD